jgi:hypothetical protein
MLRHGTLLDVYRSTPRRSSPHNIEPTKESYSARLYLFFRPNWVQLRLLAPAVGFSLQIFHLGIFVSPLLNPTTSLLDPLRFTVLPYLA